MAEFHHNKLPVYEIQVNDAEEALALLAKEYGGEVAARESVAGTLDVQSAVITPSQINRTLVIGGVDVQEIHEKKQSLEELYLQLTGGAEIE